MTRNGASADLAAAYSYDNEGRVTSLRYPGTVEAPGRAYSYSYDTLGRPIGMTRTDQIPQATVVSGVQYGPADEMTLFQSFETRTYNSLLQLVRQSSMSGRGIQYIYSATQNNGQITQEIYSGIGVTPNDTVNYTYDALGRLSHAETASASITFTGDEIATSGRGLRFTFGNERGGMGFYYQTTVTTLALDTWGVTNGEDVTQVLHELAHAMNFLSTGHNSFIQRDSDPKDNFANSNKIRDDCVSKIKF